jgi:hypothetical protein
LYLFLEKSGRIFFVSGWNAKNLTGGVQEVVGSRESAAPFDRLTANKCGGYTGERMSLDRGLAFSKSDTV